MATFTTTINLIINAAASGPAVKNDCGGRYLLVGSATNWSGATAKVQLLGPDGLTYLDVADASLTANGTAVFYLPDNAVIKGVIEDGPPTGLYLTARRCPE